MTAVQFISFSLINLVVLASGYIILKKQLFRLSWVMLIVSIATVSFLCTDSYPVMRMLAIIATTFTAMKVIAATAEYKNKPVALTFKQWFVFATGWPGMRAQPFEKLGSAPLTDAWHLIRFGLSRIAAGGILLAFAHFVVKNYPLTQLTYWFISIILLIALSLILHFGVLSISAGVWRLQGVNVHMLFRQPAKAMSLTEFWGKRWNLAFSEMTSIAIFRPLKKITGNAAALLAAFVFSGLLHELALSLPVNYGFGLPLLYFVLQGIAVLIEKAIYPASALLQNKVTARLWTFIWVVVPMPLLFHTQFVKQVVWPLAGL
ncbi:hypothetical protein EOD41_11765 [Mucilaginibacter limnophilus]|uniref:Wax synthase domain-containing protein n=1 Tax=Mucilaginibacter limnophilus TaxID=1932778 RepID=A0A3S2WXX6_9SPHI|nr:MBOAT family protein [Mucilaginibacter limnophilus]RVU00669.1 hypothetical protein EOD41_11765 [Mucilaginibacter limnophilus]